MAFSTIAFSTIAFSSNKNKVIWPGGRRCLCQLLLHWNEKDEETTVRSLLDFEHKI
jgi:hypothetical protein